mgnify:CR=1 FL=1
MKKVSDLLSDKKDAEITTLTDRVLTLEKENAALLTASGRQQREIDLMLQQQQAYRVELVGKKRLQEQVDQLMRER